MSTQTERLYNVESFCSSAGDLKAEIIRAAKEDALSTGTGAMHYGSGMRKISLLVTRHTSW